MPARNASADAWPLLERLRDQAPRSTALVSPVERAISLLALEHDQRALLVHPERRAQAPCGDRSRSRNRRSSDTSDSGRAWSGTAAALYRPDTRSCRTRPGSSGRPPAPPRTPSGRTAAGGSGRRRSGRTAQDRAEREGGQQMTSCDHGVAPRFVVFALYSAFRSGAQRLSRTAERADSHGRATRREALTSPARGCARSPPAARRRRAPAAR